MAILMEEDYWRNSHLSIARYYGGIQMKIGKKTQQMMIVDKRGITLAELSDPDSKYYVGEGMAIQPGEPADLIDKNFIPYYKKLGREKFIEILKEHSRDTISQLHQIYKDAVKQK